MGRCFFDADLMTMRIERVCGKLTPECLIAAYHIMVLRPGSTVR